MAKYDVFAGSTILLSISKLGSAIEMTEFDLGSLAYIRFLFSSNRR